jgi:hypothetical protein
MKYDFHDKNTTAEYLLYVIFSPEVIVADANSQAESIKKFMHESGMIDSYSRMCLEQNDWNYNKAGEKFLEMKAKGIIPADAWQPGRAL